jgi:hypothetical protein
MAMKKALIVPTFALVVLAVMTGQAREAKDPVAEKYSAQLNKIFALQARFAPLNPALAEVYPVAIVENKMFYVFEPDPAEKAYRLVRTEPDTMNVPVGIRAAMPLGFWDNRIACVVTGEVFGQPDGYVFIFHEFVHCAQWETCEPKLKDRLSIFAEAMKNKDYMWELQYPFPYADPVFVEKYPALLEAWDGGDALAAGTLRAALKSALSAGEWEYLTWQEWKEGLARFVENRMRAEVGLPANTYGQAPPYSRITFYCGGEKLIRFLERRSPGASKDMEKLYGLMKDGW